MFNKRKAAEAQRHYDESHGKLRGMFDGWVADARLTAPRTYPDGTTFHSEPHLTNIYNLALGAGREGDMPVVGTCMQILIGYAHPEAGITIEYLENVLGSRKLLLSKSLEAEERVLSAAALNLDSYWQATGQAEAFMREQMGKPAE